MNNALVAFQEAMRAAGVFLAADARITPDGQLHRARAADDKAGALSIWYNFHPDAPASGAAGNWRTGARLTWCGKRLQSLSHAERETLRLRIEEDKRRAQEATEARHRAAAAKASRIWEQSAPASPRHPYLDRKGIAPGIARQPGASLVLPVVDFSGALHGLQFIDEQGGKRFISGMAKAGHYIPSGGTPSPDRPLWIAEGHATACTLSALQPGVVVIAALDAGNLLSVALEARKRWPGIDLVICPDFDTIGRQKGQEAAIAARARIVKPDRLPSDLPAWVSDWNDWQQFRRQGGGPCMTPTIGPKISRLMVMSNQRRACLSCLQVRLLVLMAYRSHNRLWTFQESASTTFTAHPARSLPLSGPGGYRWGTSPC